MYGLYGHLLAKGQIAYLNAQTDVPSIGIYPEIYRGNDMQATKVIRYILQTPGLMGTSDETGKFQTGLKTFDPKDEIYIFSKVYDEWNTPDNHVLFLPIIDLLTFKDLKRKRTKIAYYVGKGVNSFQHPKEAIELTREFAQDQSKLAEFLNECQTLYVYDRLSAIMECSRLAGCKVVYLGELPLETLKLYEPGLEGLGYRKEEELNVVAFRERYKQLKREFDLNLDGFIERSQK